MGGVLGKNEEVKLFRLFESNINDQILLNPTEESFLKKNSVLNGDIIEVKDTGCFILSDL